MNTTELLNDLRGAKISQDPLYQHLIANNHPWSTKLVECGTWLHLREWLDHDCKATVVNANFCKNHWMCRACAIRRASRATAKYLEKAEALLLQFPESIPVICTWTVKNGDDLGERVSHVRNSRSAYFKAARNWKSRKRPTGIEPESTAFLGGVYNLEVKRGKAGLWHPHIHEFALLSRYVDQAKLSAEWQHYTGDSKIVGITALKGDLVKGMLEVLKYSTKFGDLPPEDVVQVYDVLRKVRCLNPWGIFRGVELGDLDQDDPLDGPYRDYIAWYLHNRKAFNLYKYEEVHGVNPVTLDLENHTVYRQHYTND